MINWFKKKHKKSKESEVLQQNTQYQFTWYEVGDGNPFNKRILDIRSFTQTMIATTSKKSIAELYNELRKSVGEEYIGKDVVNARSSKTDLRYPHNGTELRGAAFKSDSMDCKWDIYIYDSCFYFTRSWTGELVYKAISQITSDFIKIIEIQHPDTIESKDSINNVHFLILSHANRRPMPHKIPAGIIGDKEIALYSFSEFGNRACYASYEDITDTI
jgi:hypothetical protein